MLFNVPRLSSLWSGIITIVVIVEMEPVQFVNILDTIRQIFGGKQR
jgi:hypothetical protein